VDRGSGTPSGSARRTIRFAPLAVGQGARILRAFLVHGRPGRRPQRTRRPAATRICEARGSSLKQAEEASFVDLIACERDCRNCSYAAALDCDGNCGVCSHNAYCPCVNPVVARSKSALRLIELRPILLQDLRGQN